MKQAGSVKTIVATELHVFNPTRCKQEFAGLWMAFFSPFFWGNHFTSEWS